MKKMFPCKTKFSALLIGLLFLHLLRLSAQITITHDDMPNVNDTIRLSSTVSTGGIDFTLTGEDYTWDFTTLVPLLQQIDTFVSVTSTPFLYQLVFLYPFVATIAQPEPGIDFIPGFEVTDVFTFYKETDDEFHQAGVALTVTGIPLPLRYNTPDILYTFPMSYGNIDSCESTFELDLPDLIYYYTYKNRKNTIDGWGTLITPFGSFETLRIKSEVFQTDTLYIDSLNIGFKIPRNYIQYKWMANDFGVPVLQVDEEGLVVTVNYIDSLRVLTSVGESPDFTGKINIYPNPVSDRIHIEWESFSAGNIILRLCSTTGQELYRKTMYCQQPGLYRESISLDDLNLAAGTYFVCLLINTQSVIKKLIYYRP